MWKTRVETISVPWSAPSTFSPRLLPPAGKVAAGSMGHVCHGRCLIRRSLEPNNFLPMRPPTQTAFSRNQFCPTSARVPASPGEEAPPRFDTWRELRSETGSGWLRFAWSHASQKARSACHPHSKAGRENPLRTSQSSLVSLIQGFSDKPFRFHSRCSRPHPRTLIAAGLFTVTATFPDIPLNLSRSK